MSNTLPFSTTTMVYTPTAEVGAQHIAARGAGKWTFVLQEATKTLALGGTVWIQAEANEFRDLLAAQLEQSLAQGKPDTAFEYEKRWSPSPIVPPAFGDYSLASTVGLWFQSAGTEAAALLSPFISTEGFAFTPSEFIDLRERLQTAIRKYERLPNVSRGLEDLNTGFFRHRTLDESRDFISERLSIYLNKGDILHRDFLMGINQYTRRVIFSSRSQLQERHKEVSIILQALLPLKNGSGKAVKRTKREIDQRWQKYCQENKLPSSPDESTEVQLNQELEVLKQRQSQLFRDLQSTGLGLNALTADSRFVDPEVLSSLETRLTDLIREVDEAGLYQLPLGRTEAATTHRQFLRLEDLLDKLRNTERHLPELSDFYGRRHFWYAQPAHLRRLLAPLLNLPTSDWETAFTSWYFDRCLERWTKDNPPTATPSKPAAVFTANNSDTTGRVAFLTPAATIPKEITREDLMIILDGETITKSALPCSIIRLAPLHDLTAIPFSVAGLRDPVLLFSQNFFPLTPPAWRARTSPMSPPGFPEGTILCQSSEEASWIPISDWPLNASASFHLFLPLSPTEADAQRLLEIWEHLIVAYKEITFFHNWTPDDITQALLSDGFTASFLSAALLRAAEAAEFEPFDRQALVAIGQEIQLRCGLTAPSPHPLAENFGAKLKDHLPDHFFEIHQPWRDTFLSLVILSPSGKKSVLLPEGKLPGNGTVGTNEDRLTELNTAGFKLISLPSAEIWADPEGELIRIAQEVQKLG